MKIIISRKIDLFLEVIFLVLILLDTFLLFITVFLPILPSAFNYIVLFDLITSLMLILGYYLKIRKEDNDIVRRNWNGIISVTPIYFIAIFLLGVSPSNYILKILIIIKIGALILSSRQVAKAVDEFVEKSRLIYGFSFFIVVLLACSVGFYAVESGVNPEVTTYEDSLWYVVQTITTVGYGDVVPDTQLGRLIGVIAMISAIAISSLLTAATTSSLMDKLRNDREKLAKKSSDLTKKLYKRMDDLDNSVKKIDRVDSIESDIKDIKSDINELKSILQKKK